MQESPACCNTSLLLKEREARFLNVLWNKLNVNYKRKGPLLVDGRRAAIWSCAASGCYLYTAIRKHACAQVYRSDAVAIWEKNFERERESVDEYESALLGDAGRRVARQSQPETDAFTLSKCPFHCCICIARLPNDREENALPSSFISFFIFARNLRGFLQRIATPFQCQTVWVKCTVFFWK